MDDVLSFGFLVESDAIQAAQVRIAHLTATQTNTGGLSDLQATVAAQATTIAAHETTLAEHQALKDQLVTLLLPLPGNDYAVFEWDH